MSNDPKRIKAQVKKAEDVLRDLEAAIQKARKLIAESKQLVSDSKATHDAKASDEEKPSS
jgi:hypothetical protein